MEIDWCVSYSRNDLFQSLPEQSNFFFFFFFFSLCSFILYSLQRQESSRLQWDNQLYARGNQSFFFFFFPAAVIWCCGEQRQRAGVMWHSLCPLSFLITVYPSQLKVACALHPLVLPEKPHSLRLTYNHPHTVLYGHTHCARKHANTHISVIIPDSVKCQVDWWDNYFPASSGRAVKYSSAAPAGARC